MGVFWGGLTWGERLFWSLIDSYPSIEDLVLFFESYGMSPAIAARSSQTLKIFLFLGFLVSSLTRCCGSVRSSVKVRMIYSDVEKH